MQSREFDPPVRPFELVTRLEIVEAVEGAFGDAPLSREDIIAEATRSSARPAVIDILRGLPDCRLRNRSELWTYLPEVPIGH